MTKKERYAGVITYFEAQVPTPETELLYDNPFQLLVAVIFCFFIFLDFVIWAFV